MLSLSSWSFSSSNRTILDFDLSMGLKLTPLLFCLLLVPLLFCVLDSPSSLITVCHKPSSIMSLASPSQSSCLSLLLNASNEVGLTLLRLFLLLPGELLVFLLIELDRLLSVLPIVVLPRLLPTFVLPRLLATGLPLLLGLLTFGVVRTGGNNIPP